MGFSDIYLLNHIFFLFASVRANQLPLIALMMGCRGLRVMESSENNVMLLQK